MSDRNMAAASPSVHSSSGERFRNETTGHLIPLSFEGGAFRVVKRNGSLAFVAADACAILDLGNVSMAVAKLDEDEKGISSVETPGGVQDMLVVTEGGLYTLILRCRDATTPGTTPHRFRRWVTGEVLPSIRRTGSYGAPTLAPARSQTPNALFRDYVRSYKLAGFSLQDAALAANRAVIAQTGTDILGAGGVVLSDAEPALALPPVEHPKELGPTEIGVEIGLLTNRPALSGRAVNILLKQHGYQTKGATKTTPWHATTKGEPFATWETAEKTGEHGGSVNWLRWRYGIVAELIAAMSTGSAQH